jgi:hypothetical protein
MLLLVGIIASSLTCSAFTQWMSGLVVLERAKVMLRTLGVLCSMMDMFRAPDIKDTWSGGFIASFRGNSKNSFYRKIVRINRHGANVLKWLMNDRVLSFWKSHRENVILVKGTCPRGQLIE